MIGEARHIGVVFLVAQLGLVAEQAVEHRGLVAHAHIDHLSEMAGTDKRCGQGVRPGLLAYCVLACL